jgi:hypothetical protein
LSNTALQIFGVYILLYFTVFHVIRNKTRIAGVIIGDGGRIHFFLGNQSENINIRRSAPAYNNRNAGGARHDAEGKHGKSKIYGNHKKQNGACFDNHVVLRLFVYAA